MLPLNILFSALKFFSFLYFCLSYHYKVFHFTLGLIATHGLLSLRAVTGCIFSCLTITHSTRPLSPPLWLETFQIKMARNLQLILPTSIQQSSDNHHVGIWLVAYSNQVFSLVHLTSPSSHVLTALECTFKVIIQECTLCTIGRHNGLKTEFWSIKPNHQTHDLDMLQLSYSQKSQRICCHI